MKLSVIVPVYNVKTHIKQCVESINEQELSSDLFEVVFVDDGCSDNSIDIIKQTINETLNYKILQKENGGLSDARNFGLDNTNSEYVMFIDSDDYVHPQFFAKMLSKIETDKTDFVTCETFWVYENKTVTEKNKIQDATTSDQLLDNLFSSSIAAWNKIYKREVFFENKFTKGLLFEDLDFIFKIIDKYNNISFINEPLYYYRQGRKTSILNVNSVKDFDSYDEIFAKNIVKYQNTKYFKYVESYFIRRVLLSLCKKYVGSNLQPKLKEIIEKYKPNFVNIFENKEFTKNSLPIKMWIKFAFGQNFLLLKLIKLVIN